MTNFTKITISTTVITLFIYFVVICYYKKHPAKYKKSINSSKFDVISFTGLMIFVSLILWVVRILSWIWGL